MDRRGFLGVLSGLLVSIPMLGGLVLSLRVACAPAASRRPQRLPLCRLADVPQGDILVRPVSFEMRRGAVVESVSRVVFVTRDPAAPESIIAMSGECTHLSCPVQKKTVAKSETESGDGAPLRCPCHGGRFSRTGEVLGGPPPRPLRRLRIELPESDDGMIHLLEV